MSNPLDSYQDFADEMKAQRTEIEQLKQAVATAHGIIISYHKLLEPVNDLRDNAENQFRDFREKYESLDGWWNRFG